MKNIFSNCIKIILIAILVYSTFSFLFTDFFRLAQDNIIDNKTFNPDNGPQSIASNIGWKSRWYDYDYNSYTGTTRVRNADVLSSTIHKKLINASSWADLYRGMYINDKTKLDLVYPMLDRIWNNNNLTRREFIDIVVSFVQHIDYNVVSMEDCQTAYRNNNTTRELIDSGVECDGNIYAGVYSPLEFMAKFKGDCDSRTVFLYTVLKRYNYDVVILDSDLYAHSMIGVNISSSGKYKYYNGKRYYFWETTNEGWRLGMLPPSSSNINYWNAIL